MAMAAEILSVNRSRLPVLIAVKKILFRLNLAVIVQYFAEIVSGNSARTDNQIWLHVKKARPVQTLVMNQGMFRSGQNFVKLYLRNKAVCTGPSIGKCNNEPTRAFCCDNFFVAPVIPFISFACPSSASFRSHMRRRKPWRSGVPFELLGATTEGTEADSRVLHPA